MNTVTITFLEKILPRLRTGKALVAPSRNGDEAIWLARKGFVVTAYDRDPTLVAKLATRASAEQVKITAESKNLDVVILPLMSFDTIILTGEKPITRYFSEIIRALAQGGTAVVEGWTAEEAIRVGPEKLDHKLCYRANELLGLLKDLHILYYSEEIVDGRHLVRCLARKPAHKDMIKYGFAEQRPGDEKKSAAVLAAEKLFKK